MKVLIYTVSFGNKPEYIEASVSINKRYAESHGYDFEEFILPKDFSRNPAWGRVWFLMKNIPDYDYVMYIDGDAFFVDHSMSLARLTEFMSDETTCALFARDQILKNKIFHHDRANAGVFIFSNKNEGEAIAKSWWEVPDRADIYGSALCYDSGRYLDHTDTLVHHPYEQLALWFLWEENTTKFRYVKQYKDLNGLDGMFVRHLVQISDTERLRIMKGYM